MTPVAFIEIPVGETWAIRAWGAYIVSPNTSALPLQIAPVMVPTIGFGFVLAGASSTPGSAAVAGTEGEAFGITYQRPLILTGGNRLAVLVTKVLGEIGATIVVNSCAYYRLET